jgi:hypothetical protein
VDTVQKGKSGGQGKWAASEFPLCPQNLPLVSPPQVSSKNLAQTFVCHSTNNSYTQHCNTMTERNTSFLFSPVAESQAIYLCNRFSCLRLVRRLRC